jgi:hypothetical protein
MKEKRRNQRQKSSEAAVIRFEVVDQLSSGPAAKKGVITDSGPSGMGLLTEELLELGQVLKFTGRRSGQELGERAQVIWTAESQDGFRVGVKFI